MSKPSVLLIVLPYLQPFNAGAPSNKLRSWLALPYGTLSIATYCKDIVNIKIIDCNVDEKYIDTIHEEMYHFMPDIIGFTMTFDCSYPYLKNILNIVRNIDFNVIAVIGGAATLPSYIDILNEQDIDAVCYGDGEIPFKELCEHEHPLRLLAEHQSWVTRYSLRQERMPKRTPIPDLDDVITLDYSFVDASKYSLQEEFSPYTTHIDLRKRFYMLTSRGCPFRCSFCYRSRENDRKMQYASIDKIIEQVRYLIDTFGMNILTFCDDQLMCNMKRTKELFRRLIQFHIRIEVYQGIAVGFIDEEMVSLMKDAGIVKVMLNIENGSQEMLDIMVDKPVNLNKAKEAIKLFRKYGIWATAIFVMGYPGETDRHRIETLNWIREADLDWCTFNPAIPIRGTKLYDICIDNGYIRKDIKLGDLDYGNYTINVPGCPSGYVADQIYKMNLKVNFVENRAMRVGDYVTAEKMFRKVINEIYEGHAFAHYYLAECMKATGRSEMAKIEKNRFQIILMNNSKWQKYARYFGIGK